MTLISVTAPVSRAIDTVRKILFEPFDPTVWFVLGFTAWLAGLTESGGVHIPSLQSSPAESLGSMSNWVGAHLAFCVVMAIVVGVVALGISLVVSWVSSRGKFMFLDNVLQVRALIKEPWQRYRAQGNSLFLFVVCFGLFVLAVLATFIIVGVVIAWPDIGRRTFGLYALLSVLLCGGFIACFLVALACVSVCLKDFVVPIMVFQSCRVMTAWSRFWELLRAHPGSFMLYLLFRFVLTLAAGILTLLLCCLLCCTVLIPYIGVVILLPIHVFWRSYSLHFLGQFGPEYQIQHRGPPPMYMTLEHERA